MDMCLTRVQTVTVSAYAIHDMKNILKKRNFSVAIGEPVFSPTIVVFQ